MDTFELLSGQEVMDIDGGGLLAAFWTGVKAGAAIAGVGLAGVVVGAVGVVAVYCVVDALVD